MSYEGDNTGNLQIYTAMAKEGGRVHFCGVGGVSMRSLFYLSRHFGIRCSGSDRGCEDFISMLSDSGEEVYLGERSYLPDGTTLLVYSHAIAENHPERIYAREHGIIEISRAEYLGALMRCYDFKIGVSGSHGKSTVTAMIAHLLKSTGRNPTVLSGAALSDSEQPFYIGSLDYLVYEACEYRDSFLSFAPSLNVFLNMELDHVDYFKDEDALAASFLKAIIKSDKSVVNIDDKRLAELAKSASGKDIITYGIKEGADYRYEIISGEPMKMRFRLLYKEKELGEVCVSMLGIFNISNAVAAIAAAHESGVDFCELADAIKTFKPIRRRLEHIGTYKGREVYYDYAHHPTEIKASAEAIRKYLNRDVTLIFRPHTYSRTKGLWNDFKKSFESADSVILIDICGVREKEISGVSSRLLAEECGALYASNAREIAEKLEYTRGDIILMGAADVSDVKALLVGE